MTQLDELRKKADKTYIHKFTGFNKCESECEVMIFTHSDGSKIVLLVDIGKGTSVTNASELIATEIMRNEKLDPLTTLWVECYEVDFREDQRLGYMKRTPRFDQIYYVYHQGSNSYSNPGWRPVKENLLPA